MNLALARRLDRGLQPVCAMYGAARLLAGAAPSRPVTAAEPLPVHDGELAVVKLVGLGSLALLAPWLTAWQSATGRPVHLITDAANKPLTDLLDPAIIVHALEPTGGWAAAAGVVRRLRSPHLAVLDLEFYSAATTILGAACRPGVLAALEAPWRRGVLTHSLAWPEGLHFADLARYALSQLCGEPLATPPLLPLATGCLPEPPARSSGELRRVVVNASCGALCPERRLPAAVFADLLAELATEAGLGLHFVGATGDRAAVDEVLSRLDPALALTDHTGRLDLAGLLALLRSADLVISSDSGPLHLAAGVGAPTLSFFGPETPARFGPRGPGHTIVVGSVPCGPCLTAANQKQAPCRGRNVCLQQLDGRALAALARARMDGAERGSITRVYGET